MQHQTLPTVEESSKLASNAKLERYKLPNLDDAPLLAKQLKETYITIKQQKKRSVNQNRLAYIDLLNLLPSALQSTKDIASKPLHIAKTYAGDDILSLATGELVGRIRASETDEAEPKRVNKLDELKAGLLIFLEGDISRKEYRGHSSKRTKGRLYSSGSEFSKIIEETLNITKQNPISDEERFIYLSELYHYINNHIPNGKLNHPIWKTKQALLDDICSVWVKVKKRDDERVKLLTQGAPKLNMLIKYLKELNEGYKKSCASRFFSNSSRLGLLVFAEFMSKACEGELNLSGKEEEDNSQETYEAILGLILLGIMQINDEYQYIFSPEGGYLTNGSDLYKSFMQLLGVDNLNQISYDDRISWLRALTNKITHLIKPDVEEARKAWLLDIHDTEKKGLDKDKLEALDKDTLERVKKYQARADSFISRLQEERKQPSIAAKCVSKTVSFAAQYGIGCVVATQVMPLVGGLAAGILGGPVGVVVYAAAGTVLMTRLSGVVPGPVSWAYGWMLDKIGNAIGDGTINAAKYTFSMGKQGFKMLWGHPGLKPEDKEFMERYLDARLNAPEMVVSSAENTQLRMVLGREEDFEYSFTMMKCS